MNDSRSGKFVYLTPEQYFFANATTMYVTDSGQLKSGQSDAAALGEGGLQTGSLVNGVWEPDLVSGLNLVDNATANSAAPGVTGLFGLTGEVVSNHVELFTTSYGLNELSPSYLYRNHRHTVGHDDRPKPPVEVSRPFMMRRTTGRSAACPSLRRRSRRRWCCSPRGCSG